MKGIHLLVIVVIWAAFPFGMSLPLLEPHTLHGLLGIPFVPLVHTSLLHMLVNLLLLTWLFWLLRKTSTAYMVGALLTIVLWGGVSVWLAGRAGVHEGASGLVLGLIGVLVGRLELRKAMIVTAVVAAGLLVDYFAELSVSWETHLYGFLSGLCYALVIRTRVKG